jgi:RNA methyltransferase, TrmH family
MNVPLRKHRKGFWHSYALGISPTLELLRRRPDVAVGVIASTRSVRSRSVEEIRLLCRRWALEFRVDDDGLQRLGCKDN